MKREKRYNIKGCFKHGYARYIYSEDDLRGRVIGHEDPLPYEDAWPLSDAEDMLHELESILSENDIDCERVGLQLEEAPYTYYIIDGEGDFSPCIDAEFETLEDAVFFAKNHRTDYTESECERLQICEYEHSQLGETALSVYDIYGN